MTRAPHEMLQNALGQREAPIDSFRTGPDYCNAYYTPRFFGPQLLYTYEPMHGFGRKHQNRTTNKAARPIDLASYLASMKTLYVSSSG